MKADDAKEGRPGPQRRAGDHVNADQLFAGGSEMGALMRSIDWPSTALGAVDGWSPALRTMVGLLLRNRFPLLLWWGPSFVQLYNDAYRPIPGDKHPCCMGQPGSECWAEIWHIIGPMVEAPFRGEPATTSDDLLLLITRRGFLEETHFKVAYSPVPDEDVEGTGIGGVLATVAETTQQVHAERQLRTLRELGARALETRTAERACSSVAATFKENGWDVPFALFYLLDEGQGRARLVSTVGFDGVSSRAAPAEVDLHADDVDVAWPLGRVLQGRQPEVFEHLTERLGSLPSGRWSASPHTAIALPLASPERSAAYGVLICGVSPHRALDDGYRTFFELAASQVVTAIRNARAYEEQRKRAEVLAELDRAKTAFFSNISHEFRTPLTLMLGPSEAMLAGAEGELTQVQRSQLDLIHRSAVRLQKLVNALLDFSRIEAGRIQASYEALDLAALTSDVASAFRSAVERAGLRFVVDCPPLEEPIFVDRNMWEKIVLNLLSNAFKFTFEGGIEVSLRSTGVGVSLQVRDSGVGVPERELPRLFERFHRVESTRARMYGGSGIGLAFVQELVKLHGGSIRAESRLGAGTTFTVTLPRGAAHLPKERIGAGRPAAPTALTVAPFIEEASRWLPGDGAGQPAAPVGTGAAPAVPAAPGSGSRILLVDDNADMRDYVRRLLDPHWEVEAVEDGAQALASALARRPDLVLTDIMMPELDGFALLRELRARESTRFIPILMLSAHAGEEARIKGLQAGAEDYLVKPFSARELLARVRTHLELARLREEIKAQGEELYALFMQTPAAICVFRGGALVCEMANELVRKTFLRSSLIGKPLLAAIPELRGQGIDELILNVMRTGETFTGREVRVRLRSRGDAELEDTYWSFVFVPLRNLDGIGRVMVFGHDVTDQVLARRRVEQSEERFRRIVTHVQAGIAQTDFTGRFLLVNDRYCEIVGRTASQLQQLRMQDITHPEDLPGNLESFHTLVKDGTPFIIEKRYLRPDGSIVWVRNNVSQFEDPEGRPPGIIAVSLDITQQKLDERERELHVVEMERAVRFSEMFVGILGHDLRNPLSAITSAASLLSRRADELERIAKPVGRILSSADRMERMISQLLDFTQIRLGRGIPLEREQLDLVEVVRGVIEEVEAVFDRELQLEVRGSTAGSWDKDRLSQFLCNLAANACQHSPGGRPVAVCIDGSDSAKVRLEVRNQGAIRDALLPKIFEPFRQVGDTMPKAARSSGLGLGLYITQQIVLAHGGTIGVESDETSGTRFVVELPRHPPAQSGGAFSGGEETPPPPATSRG